MSLQFVKPLDSKKIYEDIQNRIKNERFTFELWKKVESICEKMQGKEFRFTKKIEKTFLDALPEYKRIDIDHSAGMYNIRIWLNYNTNKRFFIGYDDNPVFDIEKIRYYNQCYELEKSRADNLQTLTQEDINTHVNTWNSALTKLQEINKWASGFEIAYIDGFDLNIR